MNKSLTLFLFHNKSLDANTRHFVFSNIIIALVLINILLILPDIFMLFSKNGLVDESIDTYFVSPYRITISNTVRGLESLGLKYEFSFIFIFSTYIIGLIMILLNFWRIFFSISTLFLHTMILNSGSFFSYGVDFIINFLLFINLFFSLKNYVSIETYSRIFCFTIRFMQIQLCMIYFFGAFGKAMGVDWYTGEAIWLTLNLNDNILDQILPFIPKWIYVSLSLSILLLEFLYPLFVFINKRIRKYTIISISLLHVAISLIIGLHTFAITMIVFNLIAFYPKKVLEIFDFIRRLPQGNRF